MVVDDGRRTWSRTSSSVARLVGDDEDQETLRSRRSTAIERSSSVAHTTYERVNQTHVARIDRGATT